MSRKRLIIIIIVTALVIGGGITAFFVTRNQTPQEGTPSGVNPTVTIRTDKDTGAQIMSSPSGSSESEDGTGVTIIGSSIFYTNGLTRQQQLFVKDQLALYSTQNLANKYDSLTIRPQDYKQTGDTITTTVRQGETDNIVNLRFESGTTSGSMQLFITDPNGSWGGNYTSPVTPLEYE